MTSAVDQGRDAAGNGLPRTSCPFPAGSSEHREWLAGWNSPSSASSQPSAADAQLDAPLAHTEGLTGAQLDDLIGADDYEAGADEIQPTGTGVPSSR